MVVIVDDDELIRGSLGGLMKEAGLPALTFASAEEFLTSGEEKRTACLIVDIRMRVNRRDFRLHPCPTHELSGMMMSIKSSKCRVGRVVRRPRGR